MDNCTCPGCNNKLLFIQSILHDSKVEMASTTVQLKYSIQCRWCKFEFGDYDTKDELIKEFNKQYGGT